MKEKDIAAKLLADNAISNESYQKVEAKLSSTLFSLNFELKTLLYAGVLLLSSGLGVLIYKNIDSIGHMAIIAFIGLLSLGCFYFCFVKRLPYSHSKVASPGIGYDYILLFGCLTFVSFTGYLQYQYSVFGDANSLSILIPAIVFFYAAYRFDHLGVLSLAITTFAAFIGIAITPLELLKSNNFSEHRIIFYGIYLGIMLVAASKFLASKGIKTHFTFTYLNFATHLLFVFCLAGLFKDEQPLIFSPGIIAITAICFWYGFSEKSFYFVLMAVLYGYIAFTYFIIKYMFNRLDDGALFFLFFYFIGSSIAIILFLRKYSKKLKA